MVRATMVNLQSIANAEARVGCQVCDGMVINDDDYLTSIQKMEGAVNCWADSTFTSLAPLHLWRILFWPAR